MGIVTYHEHGTLRAKTFDAVMEAVHWAVELERKGTGCVARIFDQAGELLYDRRDDVMQCPEDIVESARKRSEMH